MSSQIQLKTFDQSGSGIFSNLVSSPRQSYDYSLNFKKIDEDLRDLPKITEKASFVGMNRSSVNMPSIVSSSHVL